MATQIGYKASELGMIPQEWKIRRIGDFTDCTAGGTPSTQVSSYWGGEIPWMSSGELHLKQVYDVAGRITQKGLENSSTKFVPANSVLIGLAGQGKTRGTVAISKIPLCTNQSIAAIFPTDEFNSTFLFYNLENRYDELRALSTGDGGRGGLNLTIIRNVSVKFPPLPEQTAIATALSDTDALIGSLKTLIAKKKAIKLSAMQNLLSGKIRLPAFAQRPDGSLKTTRQTELGLLPEDWEVVELGDVGKTYGGLSGKDKSDFDTGNSFYVPFTNVMANIEVDKNQLEKVEVNENQNAVLEGDLLFNGSSEIPEEVCFASLVNFSLPNLYLNSFCFGFRLTKNTIYPKYLAYWFRSEIGRKTITFMAQGSTRYNVSKSEFIKLKLVIPSKPEQTAIAQLLSDMDAEIEALQCRLKKTQSLKQGMMQALLSGKIRLPLK